MTDGGITSKQIKDGSLIEDDLHPSLRSLIHQAARPLVSLDDQGYAVLNGVSHVVTPDGYVQLGGQA